MRAAHSVAQVRAAEEPLLAAGVPLMVQLERHALVTLQLRALVRRATSSRRRTA